MSAAVHVRLPPFSRLCLLCNSAGGGARSAGGLAALVTDPDTLAALRRRLPELERELPLVSGVCRPCGARLADCQRLLVRHRAAADAVGRRYRRAAAARRRWRVTLRCGAATSLVPFAACCEAAAGADLDALVRRLVADAFGAAVLAGTIVVDSSADVTADDTCGVADGEPDVTDGPSALTAGEPVVAQGEASKTDSTPAVVDSAPTKNAAAVASSASTKSSLIEVESARASSPPAAVGGVTSSSPAVQSGPAAARVSPTPPAAAQAVPLHMLCSDPAAVRAADTARMDAHCAGSASQPDPPLPLGHVAVDQAEAEQGADDPADGDWNGAPARWSRRVRARKVVAKPGEDEQGIEEEGAELQRRLVTVVRHPGPLRQPAESRCCHMCRRTFRTERSLRAHVEKLHKVASDDRPEAARVWCPACSSLMTSDDVTGHVTERHDGRLQCDCCRVSLGDAAAAAQHCVSAHTANYMCIVCLQMYSRQEQLIGHMNSSHQSAAEPPDPVDPVSAVYGDLVRRLESRARRLHLSVLGRTAVCCPYCAQTCTLHYLRTHLYKHKAAGFRCRACDKRFKFPVSFQKHLLLHAGRADKCAQCGAEFTGRSNLLSHLRTHSAERSFACDVCQKRFKFKQTRDAHRRRAHGGDAAKVCDVCGAEFRLQYQLTVHLARHRNGRTLRCPLCPRLYELNLDLKRHLYSKHKLRVAEVERRFPEIRRRPNTLLESAAPAAAVSDKSATAVESAAAARQPLATNTHTSTTTTTTTTTTTGDRCAASAQSSTAAGAPPAASDASNLMAAADEVRPDLSTDGEYLVAHEDGPRPAHSLLSTCRGGGDTGGVMSVPADLLPPPPPPLRQPQPLPQSLPALDALQPPHGQAAAAPVLLLVDGTDMGVLMRDVLPAQAVRF